MIFSLWLAGMGTCAIVGFCKEARVRYFWFAVVFSAVPASVGATPPQIVWASETLFGVTADTLYVLRNLEDNMGRPIAEQTDILLVARDRKTNLDIRIEPVARMADFGASYEFWGEAEQIAALPLEHRVNPFDIMIGKKLRPLLSQRPLSPDLEMFSIETGVDAFVLAEKYSGAGRKYRIPYVQIAAAFQANLNATRDALPAYFVEGGDKGVDMLRDVRFTPAEDCRIEGLVPLFEETDALSKTLDITVAWIVNISCANDDTMAAHEMFFVTGRQP